MTEEKTDWQEIIQIRTQLYDKLMLKYGKLPSKKQYILEVIEDRGGMVSLQLLSRIMHYKIHLLENWVLKLNAEHKITIKGEYPNWKISLKSYIPEVFRLECPECSDLSLGVVEVTGKDGSIEGYCCLRCNKFFKKDEVKLRK